jgi:hypothetical protein
MKKEPSTEGCILAMIWFPLLLVLASTYHGFVLTKLWAWFVVPTFALPYLSLPAAIGISVIVGFLSHSGSLKTDDDSDSLGELMLKTTVMAALTPSFSLLAGYIVSRYM